MSSKDQHIIFDCDPSMKDWDVCPGYKHLEYDPIVGDNHKILSFALVGNRLNDVHRFLKRNWDKLTDDKYLYTHPSIKKRYVFIRKDPPPLRDYDDVLRKIL